MIQTTDGRPEYEAAYEFGRRVSKGLPISEALDQLEKLDVNRASAAIYISNLEIMLAGKISKRAMSADATDFFLASIWKDDGDEALNKAISALALHLRYYEKQYSSPPRKRLAVLEKYRALSGIKPTEENALDDLGSTPTGQSSPDRVTSITSAFKRNNGIRAFVVRRAEGCCEFCGTEGFSLPSGEHYVETHHIIGLADAGPDTLENVIALCPNHHREAHYGAEAENLEVKLKARLTKITSTRTTYQRPGLR